jgi:hypothetical protein
MSRLLIWPALPSQAPLFTSACCGRFFWKVDNRDLVERLRYNVILCGVQGTLAAVPRKLRAGGRS